MGDGQFLVMFIVLLGAIGYFAQTDGPDEARAGGAMAIAFVPLGLGLLYLFT